MRDKATEMNCTRLVRVVVVGRGLKTGENTPIRVHVIFVNQGHFTNLIYKSTVETCIGNIRAIYIRT